MKRNNENAESKNFKLDTMLQVHPLLLKNKKTISQTQVQLDTTHLIPQFNMLVVLLDIMQDHSQTLVHLQILVLFMVNNMLQDLLVTSNLVHFTEP